MRILICLVLTLGLSSLSYAGKPSWAGKKAHKEHGKAKDKARKAKKDERKAL